MTNAWTTVGTAGNFDSAVIEASRSQPVLVDFWAEWCGPCRSLAPLIDELASELDGALRVVKIDTDAEPALAQSHGIRSLPTLMVFRDGKPVTQAVGAQPLNALRELVKPYLAAVADDPLAEVRQAIAAGRHQPAAAALEAALAKDAQDFRLHPLLAECYLAAERFEEARALLDQLPANLAVDNEVQRLVARLNLAAAQSFPGDDAVAVAFRAAAGKAVAGDLDNAVAALLELLTRHRDWEDDKIRKTLVDLFSSLGDDPRVKRWRTQMARMLN